MTRHLGTYARLAHHGEGVLAKSLQHLAAGHADEIDVRIMASARAKAHQASAGRVEPLARRLGEERGDEPERLDAAALSLTRSGGVGLLRDLQHVHMLAGFVETTWVVLEQAAQGARDDELLDVASSGVAEARRTCAWLLTRLKAAAPQPLLVGP